MSKLSVIGIIIIIATVGGLIALRSGTTIMYKGVKPSGDVTTEQRTVSPFTKIKIDGVFKTVITQDGGDASVKVETDKNLQNQVIAKNEGETLTISNKEGMTFNNPTRMVVHINVKDLSSIENSAVGAVETKGTLKVPELYLKTDAVGKTTIRIETAKFTGDLNGVGAVELSGSATYATIDNNGVGKLSAYHLHTDTFNFTNNGVGMVEIFADKELTIDHNGVGAVYYKGAAATKNISDNGVGKVSKAD